MLKTRSWIAFFVFFSLLLVFFVRFLPKEHLPASASPAGPTVILDAGHGGEDGGAVGACGVLEKDLNLDVALKVGELLSASGISVVYTRQDDSMLYRKNENIPGKRKYFDLKNRLAYAENDPAALFVSIHMNSFTDAKYFGLQVWCAKGEESHLLAESVSASVKSRLQPENKRQVKEADSRIFLLSKAPGRAILIECGFLTNYVECQRLTNEDYRKELSFAIFCGIMEYLKAKSGE